MSSSSQKLIAAEQKTAERQARYAVRKRVNQIALGLSLGAMAFGVFWLSGSCGKPSAWVWVG